MNHIEQHIASIRATIPNGVTLICVSKFHPIESIQAAYDCGERDFGESRVQELLLKQQALPADIRWHFIGHLQTNKVKQIVPFVHMIHSVDSVRLLEVINREAEKIGRRIKVLLEVHVAKEDTKSGFMPEEITSLNTKLSTLNYIEICGIMGMATNTDDQTEWRRCFREIKSIANTLSPIVQRVSHSLQSEHPIISMGMSDDYLVAIEEGSTMVRIGSSIFGNRDYKH
ncbi:MAG: YggS family pyridoxal phosphate-dependent enzyme [Paludibacteraceae bacterium]|nr:YggS family pyridoxal phosphate-dependent enzyme [Paludibacteraceae bacterium]